MAKSKAVTRKCVGRTRAGKPCRNKPMRGRDVCNVHAGKTDTGRPSKLDSEITNRVLAALESGVGIVRAAAHAGVAASTVHNWLQQGDADQQAGTESDRAAFLDRVTRTRANVAVRLAAQLQRAGRENVDGDWRANAWLLERLAPDEFGQHQVVEHVGSVELEILGGAQPVDVPAGKRERMIAIMLEDEPEPVDAEVVE
jgi:hypothetical protein